MASAFDAIVLAGGGARRLAGLDKPGLRIGGKTLLDRVLGTVEDAVQTVVVGPPRTTSRAVVWVRESPPGGGPVAALAAGLEQVRAARVVLLAADLPFVTAGCVQTLLAAAADCDGALLVDDEGRDQFLISTWRTDALRSALPPERGGSRLGAVLTNLRPVRMSTPLDGAVPPPWFDCDTEEDLAIARASA